MTSNDKQVLSILKKHPGELGFVLQSSDYEEYVKTFKEIDESLEPELSLENYVLLKDYFGDDNNA